MCKDCNPWQEKFEISDMLGILRSRFFCSAAAETPFTRLNGAEFVGRVGTSSNPRAVAPVITSNVLNGGNTISFTCVSRQAAAKAVHAAAIANTKNIKPVAAFFKPEIANDLNFEKSPLTKGLTPFKLTFFPSIRPEPIKEGQKDFRRSRISATCDHEDLARNIHISYLKKTPLVLECMGDKAMGIITQSIALFNERVKAHDMVSYVQIISGKSPEGVEVVKMEFRLFEEAKSTH
jgi:hypothetical protein